MLAYPECPSCWYACILILSVITGRFHIRSKVNGGTQILVFLLTYTVLGGVGPEIKFPTYWGNNAAGNFDHCIRGLEAGSVAAGLIDLDGEQSDTGEALQVQGDTTRKREHVTGRREL